MYVRLLALRSISSSIITITLCLLILAFICGTANNPAEAANPLDSWTWCNPLPQGHTLNAITYGNGLFVAVGLETIMVSRDGIDWTVQASVGAESALDDFNGVAYGNGKYVAVEGYWDGSIYTSSDAVTWERTAKTDVGLCGVTFGNGLFVAVGRGTILTSADGINWNEQWSGSHTLRDVTYGNGLFVAVGGDYDPWTEESGVILTSTDGVHWTQQMLTPKNLRGVSWGNGTFVAVGNYRAYVSTDGVSWSEVEVGGVDASLWGITYANQKFVAVGGHNVWTSSDGISWTYNPLGSFCYSGSFDSVLYDVAWGDNKFVAVGKGGTIVYSNDGENWTNITVGSTTNSYCDIAYGNGIYVGIGADGFILRSTDGISWNRKSSSPSGDDAFHQVTYGDGVFVIVGQQIQGSDGSHDQVGLILTSQDGTNWTAQTVDVYEDRGEDLWGIAYGDGKFVAVGDHGIILTSHDGRQWVLQRSHPGEYLFDVAYSNGKFVAVGDGVVVTSQDGANWTKQTVNFKAWAVTHGNGCFVAVGDEGAICSSGDGVNWSERRSGVTATLRDVGFYNDKFVAAGSSGTILTSLDGENWNRVNSGTFGDLHAVDFINGTWIASGGSHMDSTIVTSNDGINWSCRSTRPLRELRCIAGGGNTVVAAGRTIASSYDGVHWTDRKSTSLIINDITYGNQRFVAVGEDGLVAASSDGINWNHVELPFLSPTADLQGLAYGNGTFVAVGDGGTVLTSTDGRNWTSNGITNSPYLRGISYGNNVFVAVAKYASYTSSDGVNWTQHSLPGSPRAITFANGLFVVVCDGRVLTSDDGAVWTDIRIDTSFDSISFGNGIFVAVNGNCIYTSPNAAHWSRRPFLSSGLQGVGFFRDRFFVVGDDGMILQSDRIPAPPVARFTYRPSIGPGQGVTFDASGSYCTNGEIVAYKWDFGDGTGGTGVQTTHTFPCSGTYEVRLTVVNNCGVSSTAVQRCPYYPVVIPPDQPVEENGGRQSVTIGPWTVEADSIVSNNDNTKTARGNVSLNGWLRTDAELTLDETNEEIRATFGTLYIPGPFNKSQKIILFRGEIALNGGEIQLLSNVPGKIYLSGLPFELKRLALVDGLLRADLEGEIIGAKYRIEKATIGPQGISFEARVTGETVPLISYKGFNLKDATVRYDSVRDLLEGAASVGIPRLWKIDGLQGTLGFLDGDLNRIELGATFAPPGIPLGSTSFAMTELEGGVDNLARSSTNPLTIEGRTSIATVWGLPIKGKYQPFLTAKDVTVTIDFSWRVVTKGDLCLFDYELASAKAELSSARGMDVEGGINLSDILTGRATFKVSSESASGSVVGTLTAPEDWKVIGGKTFAELEAILDTEKVATTAEFFELFKVAVAFYYASGFQVLSAESESQPAGIDSHTVDGHRVEIGTNLRPIACQHPLAKGLSAQSTEPSVVLEEPYGQVVLRVTWSEGDSGITLVTPDGTRITATDTISETDGAKSLKLEKEAYFVLTAPALGVYRLEYDTSQVTGLQMEAFSLNSSPTFTFTEVAYDPEQKTARIQWRAADPDDSAAITLYYDDDLEGANGIPIVSNLSTTSGESAYQWDLSTVPTGQYYVFAKVDDGYNTPVIVYSDTLINHVHPQAPEPPANVTITPRNGGLDLSWQNAPGVTTCQVSVIEPAQQETVLAFNVEDSQGCYIPKDAIAPGEYLIRIASVSAGDVQSSPVERYVTVVEATPPILDLRWSNDTGITASNQLALTATLADGVQVSVDHQGQPVRTGLTGIIDETFTLEPGYNLFVVHAVDQEGDEAEAQYTIYYDDLKPFLEVEPFEEVTLNGETYLQVKGLTVPNADLTINDQAATADSDGSFCVQVHSPINNVVVIRVRNQAGNETIRAFLFAPQGSVSGQVYLEGGLTGFDPGLLAVRLKSLDSAGETYQGSIARDGRFSFTNIARGTYDLIVSYPGYLVGGTSVSVTAGRNTDARAVYLSAGDVDGDNIVDVLDLVALAQAYGTKQGGPSFVNHKDYNRDGVLDIYDLVLLTRNFGQVGFGGTIDQGY